MNAKDVMVMDFSGEASRSIAAIVMPSGGRGTNYATPRTESKFNPNEAGHILGLLALVLFLCIVGAITAGVEKTKVVRKVRATKRTVRL